MQESSFTESGSGNRRSDGVMDRIVFVIPDMPGGGTERVVALLANEYGRRGIAVTILLFAGHETAYPLGEGVEVVSVGNPSGGSVKERLGRILRMRRFYKAHPGCQIWSWQVYETLRSSPSLRLRTLGLGHSLVPCYTEH